MATDSFLAYEDAQQLNQMGALAREDMTARVDRNNDRWVANFTPVPYPFLNLLVSSSNSNLQSELDDLESSEKEVPETETSDHEDLDASDQENLSDENPVSGEL
jgi:hypothetical protein